MANARSKKRVEQLEELVKIMQFALPPVVAGEWDTFSLKATGCDIKLAWDADCEEILFVGKIRP